MYTKEECRLNQKERFSTGTGKLNFESFCRVALHFNEEVDDEALQKELKEAFRLYDKDGKCSYTREMHVIIMFITIGNGFIPISSLREILGALDDQLTGEQLNEMIAEIDTDQSGTVDFDGKKLVYLTTFKID